MTNLLSHSWINEDINAKRFCESLRHGWNNYPEVLSMLQSGEMTSTDLAHKYFDDAPNDVTGLTFEQVADCIEYCIDDPTY